MILERLRRRAADDRGSTLPLTIFYGVLCLLVVLVAIAATSLYLERKRLFTIADAAALVGAESFTLDQVRSTDAGYRPELDTSRVASAVDDYLATAPVGDLEQLRVERAATDDGTTATVALSAFWKPPVVTFVVPQGFRIEVTAVARSVFG